MKVAKTPNGDPICDSALNSGLDRALALQVAEQLMARDALGAHARDELGISDTTAARPVQAALASAVETVSVASLVFLALLGVVGAKAGGANMLKAAVRVAFWGALAMAVTAGVGAVFGTQI
jgi:vacuolar iron transporter family protein